MRAVLCVFSDLAVQYSGGRGDVWVHVRCRGSGCVSRCAVDPQIDGTEESPAIGSNQNGEFGFPIPRRPIQRFKVELHFEGFTGL